MPSENERTIYLPKKLERTVVRAFFDRNPETVERVRDICKQDFGDEIIGFFIGDNYIFAETLDENGKRDVEPVADIAQPLHANYLNRTPQFYKMNIYSDEPPFDSSHERFGLKRPEVLRGVVEFLGAYRAFVEGDSKRLASVVEKHSAFNVETRRRIHETLVERWNRNKSAVDKGMITEREIGKFEDDRWATFGAADYYFEHVYD